MDSKDISERKVFFCDSGYCEYLNISVIDWGDTEKDRYEWFISLTAEPRGFLDRLKKAWEIIWKGYGYIHEIVLTPKDWKQLRKFFIEKERPY